VIIYLTIVAISLKDTFQSIEALSPCHNDLGVAAHGLYTNVEYPINMLHHIHVDKNLREESTSAYPVAHYTSVGFTCSLTFLFLRCAIHFTLREHPNLGDNRSLLSASEHSTTLDCLEGPPLGILFDHRKVKASLRH
jgi:hypothetical protein